MNLEHNPQFSLAITALLESHNQEATKPRLLGYWLALRDLELKAVENAVVVALQTIKGRPADPAQLREIATGGSAFNRAVLAWDDVQRAARVSYMADLDFEDYLINAVIRQLGGRDRFFDRINASADAEKWVRIEFLKVYETYAQTPPGPEATAVLEGQATHGKIGNKTHTPRLEVIRADRSRLLGLPKRPRLAIHANKDPFQSSTMLKRVL